MKIKIFKDDLLKGTQTVQNVISVRTALPILSNLLLETEKDKVKMTATDLDIGILTWVPANIEEEGSITIPAKRFADIVKELPDGEILLETRKNNQIVIEAEPCFFKIMGLPKDEFPKPPQLSKSDKIVIDQAVFKKMLKLTSFAMSHDETRYVLNGILFKAEEGFLELVATDGRRLAVIKRKLNTPKGPLKKVITPFKAINELNRSLQEEGQLEILLADNQVGFNIGDTKIVSRLIEGEFPNYTQVIPREIDEKIKVDRNRFLEAIKRITLLTSQDSPSIKLELFKNKIVVSKNTPEIGQGQDVIELTQTYEGKELSIGFNPNYLADALRNIDREIVSLEVTSSEKPAVFRVDQEYIYVVLPMQLT
jgi:DNA polymerase-3 subunit beta